MHLNKIFYEPLKHSLKITLNDVSEDGFNELF